MRLFKDIERFGSRTAVIDERGEVLSYSDLVDLGHELVRPLAGARRLVLLEMANAVAPIAAYVGALRAGHAVILAAQTSERLEAAFNPGFVFKRTGDTWAFEARSGDPVELHEDLAVLLSTSGSTGSPKLVRLSHANLVSNAHAICQYLEISSDERAITALPAYYSYGMSVINAHLEAGADLVLTDQSVTEDGFWDRFRLHEATSFAGVPHTFELLERTGFLDAHLPSLRYFTQAGGKLAPDKIKTFARHAQTAGRRFYVMYGQTEASPRMAFVPPQDIAEYPGVIGRAIPGGTLTIEPLGEETGPGELVYRGPNVMMGYAHAAADLALPQGPDVLRTGDLAEAGPKGYFRIVGRASRFAKIFGLRIAFDEVEALMADMDAPGAAIGNDEGLVVATTAAGRQDEVRAKLASRLGLPPSRVVVALVAEIPRLPAGKIDYPAILRLRDADTMTRTSSLRAEIASILGLETIGDGDTFLGLGGDSLSYVQASLVIEKHLGAAPQDWETLSLRDLELMSPVEPGRGGRLEGSVLVRALAILAVVANHAFALGLGGAATALLIVAGLNFSRFQRSKLEQGGSAALIRTTLLRVALPYLLVVTLYFVMLGEVFWPQYLFYGTYTDGLMIEGVRRFQTFWFIELYVALMVGLAALYLIPAVRRASKAQPLTFAIAAFAVAMVPAIAARVRPDLPVFQAQTAVALGYVFAYGWLLERMRSMAEKAVGFALGMTLLLFLPPDRVAIAFPIAAAAITTLLFVRRVAVGAVAARVLSLAAASSLYIYILHGLVIQVLRKVLGDPLPLWGSALAFAGGVAAGVAAWRALEILLAYQQRLAAARLKRVRLPQPVRETRTRPKWRPARSR